MGPSNIVDVAQSLAGQNDRVAFFVSLIALAFVGAWLVRWLVGQNQKLVDSLNTSHAAYSSKLETIMEKQRVEVQGLIGTFSAELGSERKHSEMERDKDREARHESNSMIHQAVITLGLAAGAIEEREIRKL